MNYFTKTVSSILSKLEAMIALALKTAYCIATDLAAATIILQAFVVICRKKHNLCLNGILDWHTLGSFDEGNVASENQ